MLRELLERRELLFLFTYREIQVRYKQSVMGVLWAVFMPAMVVATGLLVRYAIALLGGKELDFEGVAAVSVKAIPWAFFVGAVRAASSSLISHRNLVTKIYFPRTILPVSAVLSQMVDFLVASAVVFVALALVGLGIGMTLVMAPIVLLILVMLVLGISLIVSAASLFLRDVKYIVEVVLTFAIFFTPVFYDVDMFPQYADLLLLNPVAPLLEALRNTVVLHTWPMWGWLLYSLVWSLLLVGAGLRLFRRLEPAFAESI